MDINNKGNRNGNDSGGNHVNTLYTNRSVTEEEFKSLTDSPQLDTQEIPDGSIPGLDSFEFTWNVKHALRPFYNRLKKEMYSKYSCDDHDNVDLKIIIDEILVLKTQLHGVGRMIRDGKGPKNLSYRVREHQKNLRENMQILLKYTRKEPEKSLKKTMVSKGKELADSIKDKISDVDRSEMAKAIRNMVRDKFVTKEDDEPPFED